MTGFDEHAIHPLVDEDEQRAATSRPGSPRAPRPSPRASATSSARRGGAGRRRRLHLTRRMRSDGVPYCRIRDSAIRRRALPLERSRSCRSCSWSCSWSSCIARASVDEGAVVSLPRQPRATADPRPRRREPSRRIAGAAAERTAAARLANALGVAVFARAARDADHAAGGAAPARAAAPKASRVRRGALREPADGARASGPRPRARRGARTAGTPSSSRRASSSARNPETSCRAANANGVASGWNVCTITLPGASRPLLPASCVTSWNVRSSARKSGKASPASASTTAATATPGKWWPFATICVPIRATDRVEAKRSRASRRAPDFGDGVRVEPNPLEAGELASELRLEPLRARADPRELDGAALRAGLGQLRRMAAVVAVEPPVAMQRQRDVAARAPASRPARAAVDRAGDPAPVEEEDRAAASISHGGQLREQRRRERIAGLAAQVDEPDGRQRRADASGKLEPLEPRPALRARRRAPVDGDRALDRGALRGHGSRVVPRVRLLLERRVVLLVDDDEPEPVDGREDRRARADDDARSAGCAGARARRAARPPSARSAEPRRDRRSGRGTARRVCGVSAISGTRTIVARSRASAAAAAWRYTSVFPLPVGPCRRKWPPPASSAATIARRGLFLSPGEASGLRLSSEGVACGGSARLAAASAGEGRDQGESTGRRRAVVVGQPQRELDERRRHAIDDDAGVGDLDSGRRLHAGLDDDAAQPPRAEPHLDDVSGSNLVRHAVRERARERASRHERVDLGERHRGRA